MKKKKIEVTKIICEEMRMNDYIVAQVLYNLNGFSIPQKQSEQIQMIANELMKSALPKANYYNSDFDIIDRQFKGITTFEK